MALYTETLIICQVIKNDPSKVDRLIIFHKNTNTDGHKARVGVYDTIKESVTMETTRTGWAVTMETIQFRRNIHSYYKSYIARITSQKTNPENVNTIE